jgi:hypothetical protein
VSGEIIRLQLPRSAPAILALVTAAFLTCGVGADAAATPSDGARCPRISEAAKLPLRPGGGRLRGDVDGDGHPDRVSVRYAPRSWASCGFLLVVKTRSRLLAARVPEWYKPPQDSRIRDWWLAEPFLAAVVQLARHRSQIVVARSHSASVVNVSLFGVVGGKLVLLHLPRPDREALPLFGTIGTGDTNARCVRGGPLILLGRGPLTASGSRWFISRSEYRLVKNGFVRMRIRSVRSSMRRVNALAHRWGMDALPFTGCIVVRGRHL